MNPLYEYDLYKKEGYKASVDEWEDWAERIVACLKAELAAAERDHKRYKSLEKESTMRQNRYKLATGFRIVIQIEQLDDDGTPLCIYGPADPAVVLLTDDADLAIDLHERMYFTLREEFDCAGRIGEVDSCMDCRMPVDRCIC